MDIFSVFDDHHKVFGDLYSMMWVCSLLWLLSNTCFIVNNYNPIITIMGNMAWSLCKYSQLHHVVGSVGVITSVLYFVGLSNLLGLVPYTFSLTSHIGFNLSLSLPLWGCLFIMSMSFNWKSYISHLQPLGSPSLLNPFLCVIELVSLLVRPLTLAIRITANLSAGHILLVLMGNTFSSSPALMLMFLGAFYLIYEVAVSVIQAYIFTLLPTLYSSEHPNL